MMGHIVYKFVSCFSLCNCVTLSGFKCNCANFSNYFFAFFVVTDPLRFFFVLFSSLYCYKPTRDFLAPFFFFVAANPIRVFLVSYLFSILL
jgi:hypothetical protein